MKRNSSTVMCATMLLETVEYYVSIKFAILVLYIDASKAFDSLSLIVFFPFLRLLYVVLFVVFLVDFFFSYQNILSSFKKPH